MKIAVSAKEETAGSEVDPRSGRALCFLVFDAGEGSWHAVNNSQALGAAHGAGIQAAETVCRLGADAVISGHVGPKAFAVLAAGGVKVYHTDPQSAHAAVEAFRRGELRKLRECDAGQQPVERQGKEAIKCHSWMELDRSARGPAAAGEEECAPEVVEASVVVADLAAGTGVEWVSASKECRRESPAWAASRNRRVRITNGPVPSRRQ